MRRSTGTVYVCNYCQTPTIQPLGRFTDRTAEGSKNVNYHFSSMAGPPCPAKCSECGSGLHVAGPMWIGPLHNPDFIDKMLLHVESGDATYATAPRIKGMLSIARNVSCSVLSRVRADY